MTSLRRLAVALVCLALLAGACSGDDDSDAAGAANPPTTTAPPTTPTTEPPDDAAMAAFEPTPCWFDVADGREIECGHLVVPADRSAPDDGELRLAVAVLRHPDGASEPDPIIYLSGGPGERFVGLLEIPQVLESLEPLFATGRDLVVFDQRGVGLSEPTLACSLGDTYLSLLDGVVDGVELTSRELSEELGAQTAACGEELSGDVDLSWFTTAASAADVEDLRTALRYEQVNLWGVSYGTRLAQAVMRDHPEGIRSVTLDAIMPQDLELIGFVEAADRAFTALVEGCAADEACNAAFPDLGGLLADTVAGLDADPPVLELEHPQTGEPFEVRLSGDLFRALLYQALYDTETIGVLPSVIAATHDGDVTAAAQSIPGLVTLDRAQDFGMGLSVRCNRDRVNLPTLAEYDALVAEHPELVGFADLHFAFRPLAQACQDWPSGEAAPESWEPVSSAIPTLAITGEYDPNLAPEWGEEVAAGLGNAHSYTFPGIGHGSVGTHPCPTAVFVEFVVDPGAAPDDSCRADMGVRFAVPAGNEPPPHDAGGDVELEPFTSEALGITGVAPAGWAMLDDGVWTRSDPGTDPVFLVQQAVPADQAEAAVTGIAGEVAGADLGDPVESFDLDGTTWEVAVAEGELGVVVGRAAAAERVLIVALAAPPDQLDGLVESVFRPALAVLQEVTS